MDRLSSSARTLLRRVEAVDKLEATGPDAKDLQERLLVRAIEVHTGSGRHAVALQSWPALTTGMPRIGVERAKRDLETAAAAIGAPASSLPWNRRKRSGAGADESR